MKCQECLPLIEEYVDGELGERPGEQLAAHLATCSTCASEVSKLEREQEIYAQYQRDIAVTPAQWNVVRARIEQEKEQQRAKPRARFREWFSGLFGKGRRFGPALVLALLLIFIGVTAAIIYNSRNRGSSELAVQPQKQIDVRPQTSPQETQAPGKANDNNQAVVRNEKEKNSNNQAVTGKPPGNSREKVAVVAVNRRQPAPQQIKSATPANAPRFEEAVAERESAMTDMQRSTLSLAGDFDSEIARHAEKAELLLRSFRNIKAPALSHALDVSYEKEESRKLLYQNISLRRDAEARGDQSTAALLNTLEPILLDIAHLPKRAQARDVSPIEQRMQKKEIVAALQVRALVASN
jgi:hypothetical protein